MDDVFVAELLLQTALHRAKLTGASPDHGVSKLTQQVPMNLHDGRLDIESASPSCQEKRVLKIGRLSPALRIDAYESKLLPDLVQHDVDTKVHMDRNATVLRILHELIDILN